MYSRSTPSICPLSVAARISGVASPETSLLRECTQEIEYARQTSNVVYTEVDADAVARSPSLHAVTDGDN
jgi:hypothetical protein